MRLLPCRRDPLVALLNDLGYTAVELPRTGIVPPHVYVDDEGKRVIGVGPLARFIPGGHPLGRRKSGELPEISRKTTASMDVRAAGSFLERALYAIGVDGSPKLDLSFVTKHKLHFTFSNVSWVGFDPADIGLALHHADFSSLPQRQVEGDMLLVAYEFAYARKLVMSVADDYSSGIDLKAVKLESFIELGAKAKVEVASRTTLSFAARPKGEPVAFAFKSGQVRRERGRYAFDVTRLPFAPGAPPAPQPYIRGAVLMVEEAD